MSICSLLAGIGVATLSPKIKNTKFLADMFKDYNSFHNHEIFIPVHLGFEKNISILHANELVLMLQWSQKSLFFQHYHNLTAHKYQLLCLPVHKQILSSIFSISPHVPCLNSAAFMFAWRTFERGVRLKGGQRSFFEELVHLRLSPNTPPTCHAWILACCFMGFTTWWTKDEGRIPNLHPAHMWIFI